MWIKTLKYVWQCDLGLTKQTNGVEHLLYSLYTLCILLFIIETSLLPRSLIYQFHSRLVSRARCALIVVTLKSFTANKNKNYVICVPVGRTKYNAFVGLVFGGQLADI